MGSTRIATPVAVPMPHGGVARIAPDGGPGPANTTIGTRSAGVRTIGSINGHDERAFAAREIGRRDEVRDAQEVRSTRYSESPK